MHPDKDVDQPVSSRPQWFLVFLAVACVVLLVIILRRPGAQPVGMQHQGVGKFLENFAVEPLLNTERKVTHDDLQGKVTLINFWGPWCPPCLMELPELLKLEKKYRGRSEVQFLLISYSNDRDETAEELRENTRDAIARQKADPAIYHDPQGQVPLEVMNAARLDGFGFPTTLVLDRSGKIRAVWSGYDASFVGEMGQVIELVLAEKKT